MPKLDLTAPQQVQAERAIGSLPLGGTGRASTIGSTNKAAFDAPASTFTFTKDAFGNSDERQYFQRVILGVAIGVAVLVGLALIYK